MGHATCESILGPLTHSSQLSSDITPFGPNDDSSPRGKSVNQLMDVSNNVLIGMPAGQAEHASIPVSLSEGERKSSETEHKYPCLTALVRGYETGPR